MNTEWYDNKTRARAIKVVLRLYLHSTVWCHFPQTGEIFCILLLFLNMKNELQAKFWYVPNFIKIYEKGIEEGDAIKASDVT
jgi:hypothetical protein